MVPTGPWFCCMLLTFFLLFHPTGINSVLSMTPLIGQGSCLLSLVSFWLFHPPGIISLSFSSSQHGQNHIGCCWPPSDYYIHQESCISPPCCVQQGQDNIVWCWLPSKFSIPQESPLFFTWKMPFPPSRRQPLSPLPFVVSGYWAGDLSFIPFTVTWTEDGFHPFCGLASF